MKWKFLTCLWLFVSVVNAQKIDISAALEFNHNVFEISDANQQGSGFGYNLRVPVIYHIGGSFVSLAARPGISSYKPEVALTSGKFTYNYLYATIPVYLSVFQKKQVALYAGCDFEYLLKRKDASGATLMGHINVDYCLGITAGVSYNFKRRLQFNVFYSYGINSLTSDIMLLDSEGNETRDLEIAKKYLTIGFSYKFN